MGPESLRLRDGPLENLGGWGRERSTKKYSGKGKLNEKIHACPKKNSYKEFDNEKKFLWLAYVSCFCCPAIT